MTNFFPSSPHSFSLPLPLFSSLPTFLNPSLTLSLSLQIRTIFSDFAVFFSVVMWVVVDVLARVDTPKLEVPNVFESGVYSQENRSFIVNPLGERE